MGLADPGWRLTWVHGAKQVLGEQAESLDFGLHASNHSGSQLFLRGKPEAWCSWITCIPISETGVRGTALTFVYPAAVKERPWTGSKDNWDLVLVLSLTPIVTLDSCSSSLVLCFFIYNMRMLT